MRGRFAIVITIALVVLLLVVLNAASYVSVERTRDTESDPDRSTYNSGSTGTRALYDFLSERNSPVMRWREPAGALLKSKTGAAQPRTFVVVGETRLKFDESEAKQLLSWVELGGRLVIIDRQPDVRLLPASGDWNVSTQLIQLPTADARSTNPDEMTAGVSHARVSQPTALTHNVERVLPSRFAALIKIAASAKPTASASPAASPAAKPTDEIPITDEDVYEGEEYEPTPTPKGRTAPPPPVSEAGRTGPASSAPVVHLADYRGALLVDYPHGDGRIIILSDPFIVANKGIIKEDNLQLAVNLLTSFGGPIAFDEYHQGRGTERNELLNYFAGTPVVAMLLQLGVIVLAVLWTNGRRFARPLPVQQIDRRSSLEFVASMAELQQRARAYDLAIENIYARIRRVLARYAGVDTNSHRSLIAERVAARSSKLNRQQLESLMFECEEAINGAPVDAKKSLDLIARLREAERLLGLRMRTRDIRQAKEQKG
jgi:septal ring-binding cell division protein DamX